MFRLHRAWGMATQKHLHCLLLVTSALIGTPGCRSPRDVESGPPPSHFQHPGITPLQVRRVVMLPLANLAHDNDVADDFSRLLAAELRTKGAFDLIVPAHADILDGTLPLAGESLFDERTLAYLGRKYRADAVIVGRVNHFHAYWPPSISVSLHCVDTRQGLVLASIDGNWDARNKFIARQAKQFYTYLHPQETLHDDQLMLNSPSYFQKFVAHQIAETFFKPPHWNAEPLPAEILTDTEM